ncbi:PTS sugar transporter IIA component [Ligilactobacillus salitolerans]|uniref:PTS sugar transporter IIA component n=1 Tax=Ligilactobacillus salitolerans TaxID=1808352 RepID=A0A401ISE9_9LACO|nr:PTS sugar transporter subunit IIA [Ligilactobacillus salitolerans]GBG94425.1 PTS sugar transporter IIA component [Ligilactobacillus salitolerans]
MEKINKAQKRSFWSIFNFGVGNIGGSAVYMTFGTYLMVYVTSAMFTGVAKSESAKLISMITTLIFVIRIVEIFIDPVIGSIVDNTNTRWGKFKPWLIGAGLISSLLLIVLFTGIFGLSRVNSTWFALLFIPTFILFDIFYSFRDVAYWGMIPALTEDSHKRSIYTAAGNFSGFGQNLVTVIIVPVVTYFTFLSTGKHNEGQPGWTVFAVMIAVVAVICSFAVGFGTHEKQSVLRQGAKKKVSLKEMFSALFHNDQMLWTAIPYLVYGFGNAATAGLMFYMFKYVIDRPGLFWITGVIPIVSGFITNPTYPLINKWFTRKTIYSVSMVAMIIAYLILIFSPDNLFMLITAMILYYGPQGYIFMAVLLTLEDSVEYGQLKNGVRNETVTLSIRPMLDKLSSALSNGIVGWVAVAAGMTGGATAESITPHGIAIFKLWAFWAGLLLHVLALVIYLFKVKISEKRHAEIVDELQHKIAAEGLEETEDIRPTENASIVAAPTSGKIINLEQVVDEKGNQGLQGQGLAIEPFVGELYAPFDGEVSFVFTTKHVFGLRSADGLALLVHVGLGTANMHGASFVPHVESGQKFKQGQLLLDFNRDEIRRQGYKDTVVVLLVQGDRLQDVQLTDDKEIKLGDELLRVNLKK